MESSWKGAPGIKNKIRLYPAWVAEDTSAASASPLRLSGQYCPRCHEESLSRHRAKDAEGKSSLTKHSGARKAKPATAAEGGRRNRIRSILAGVWSFLNSPVRRPGGKAGSSVARWWHASLDALIADFRELFKSIAGSVRASGRWLRTHYPLTIRETARLEGGPALKESWVRLAVSVLAGVAVWTLVVGLTQHRSTWISLVVAAIVAVAVVWALGSRFGLVMGLVTCLMVLLTLAVGELAAQLLHRLGVIHLADAYRIYAPALPQQSTLQDSGSVLLHLFVYRMLPAAALAFLIGWWPLRKKPGWRGFSGAERTAKDGVEDSPMGSVAASLPEK